MMPAPPAQTHNEIFEGDTVGKYSYSIASDAVCQGLDRNHKLYFIPNTHFSREHCDSAQVDKGILELRVGSLWKQNFLNVYNKLRQKMKLSDLKGKRIGFAASGGLDSCTVTHWLSQRGVEVVCFTADIGQTDEDSSDAIEKRMRGSGAADFVKVDLRSAMAEIGLDVVQAQATYEGNY